MMEPSLDQLVGRLAAGEDPYEISRSLLPPGERELLRRCAAVRTFDQALFAEELAAGIEELSGYDPARLVTEGYAEPVPGPAGRYRLRSGVRAEWLREWWPRAIPAGNPPPALVEFNRRLADRHGRAGNRVEALYHLVLADPERARQSFLDLFHAADDRFDLTGCQDLIDVLCAPDRLPHLTPELSTVRTDYDAYLRARTHWSAEWYQSARLLDRAGLHDALVGLLEPGPGRVLQVYAPGGMGKTIQLRWFIARWCIPRPRRIPCARVDLDLVQAAQVGGHPWLLLLEFADQLNRQLPGNPFQELLAEHGGYRALLEQRPTPGQRTTGAAEAAAGLLADAAQAGQVARQVLFRFTHTLNESTAGRPVVLIVDTLEEVMLRAGAEPRRLLAVLAEVCSSCPDARLVLVGRYDLRERVPDLQAVLPDVRSVPLERFTPAECAGYLTGRRGITQTDLVEAMTATSGGLPFTLALLADVVATQPDITAEAVRAYHDPSLLYLIERVVTRIDDPAVRWLLRYGVVPRQLSLQFVTEVMRPYLVTGMSGTSTVDNPGHDRRPQRRATGQPFPTDVLASAQSPLDIEAVWASLLRYAGGYSWVSRYAERPDTVVFHPEVVEPMRRLLREHEVYRRLHLDATVYCLRRAEQEPGAWLWWAREAVYHRFQAEGPAAGTLWRELLGQAGQRGGAAWRGELAAELLRREYLDEQSRPRDWRVDVPMLTWSQLAQAHLEVARSAVDTAESGQPGRADPLLDRAWTALEITDAICAEQGLAAPSRSDRALVWARMILLSSPRHRTSAGGALSDTALFGAIRGEVRHPLGTDQGRPLFVELAANALSRRDPGQAIERYRELLDRTDLDSGAGRRVRRKLMWLLADRDRLDEALAIADREPQTGPLTMVELAKLRLRAGQPGRVLKAADRTVEPGGDPLIRAARHWCTAAARLALLHPVQALTACRAAVTALGSSQTPEAVRLGLELRELRARTSAALLDIPAALGQLEKAIAGWRELGEAGRVCRAAAITGEFDPRAVGRLRRHLALLLDQGEQTAPDEGSEEWLLLRLCRAQLLAEDGHPDRARDIVDSVLRAHADDLPPRLLVRGALAGLAALPSAPPVPAPLRNRYLEVLVTGLSQVRPSTARLPLLDRLACCPAIPGSGGVVHTLRALADPREYPSPPAGADRLGRAEWSAHLCTLAELHRVAGQPARAAELLRDALQPGSIYVDFFRLWRWLDAAARTGRGTVGGLPHLDTTDILEHERAAQELGDFPALAGAFLVTLAAGRIDDRAGNSATRLLDTAEQLLTAAGAQDTDWYVGLQLLRAALARRAGDLVGHSQHLGQGLARWRGLGRPGVPPYLDLAELPALTGNYGPPEPGGLDAGGPPVTGVRGPLTVSLDLTGRIEVSASWDTTSTRARHRTRVLFGATAPGRITDYQPYDLIERFLTDWVDAGARLGRVLLPRSTLAAAGRGGGRDIFISTGHALLAALPWELARSAGVSGGTLGRNTGGWQVLRTHPQQPAGQEVVLALQRALRRLGVYQMPIDADFGAETRRALIDFQHRVGDLVDEVAGGWAGPATWRMLHAALRDRPADRSPAVLVVRPSLARELDKGRGDRLRGGDLVEQYRAAGFRVQTLENPDPAELDRMLSSTVESGLDPVAVHLAGSFGTSGPDVFLDFGSATEPVESSSRWTGPGSAEALFCTSLDRALARLPAHLTPPLLVLDPDWPGSQAEGFRQLLLRNAFAHQLFALGNVPIVLAVGLDPRGGQSAPAAVVDALAGGGSAVDACRAYRAVDNDLWHLAAAVWSRLPSYAMPRTWAERS